jgi:iron complex outermembrane recepter protein
VAGAFYIREKQTGTNTAIQTLQGTGASSLTDADGPGLEIKSKAVFGQATYSILEDFRVIGGLRYTRETSSMTASNFACSVTVCPGALLFSVNDASVDTNKLTWKSGLEYDLTPHNFLYATYSTGFKAGGLFTAPPPNSYKPEVIRALEIGSRNRFYDGRVELNFEAYKWNYSDQVNNFVGPAPTSGYVTLVFVNVGRGSVEGFSAELAAKPWRDGTLRFSAEFANSRYDNFLYDSLIAQKGPANTACAVGPVHSNPQHIPVQTVDCSGHPFILAPKWSGNASYEHDVHLDTMGDLVLVGTVNFTSTRYRSSTFYPVSCYQTRHCITLMRLTPPRRQSGISAHTCTT